MPVHRYLRIFTLIVSLLSFLVTGLPAAADLYKWVDEKGVVHFSDQPPSSRDSDPEVEISPSAPPSTWQPPPKKQKEASDLDREKSKETVAPQQSAKPPKVDLYVTSWCKYCKMARNYLRANKVAFNEYDIDKDGRAAKRRQELDPRPGVPLAVINGQIIVGFSESSYARALKTAR
jgi:glutaredoxin